jgi:hypothetical protein
VFILMGRGPRVSVPVAGIAPRPQTLFPHFGPNLNFTINFQLNFTMALMDNIDPAITVEVERLFSSIGTWWWTSGITLRL